MIMGMGQNLRKYRKLAGMTQRQLAEAVGVKHNTISDWETGRTSPDTSEIVLLCNALAISADMLLGTFTEQDYSAILQIDGIVPIETQKIPLLGTIAAGEPIYAEKEFECYVECGVEIKADFALRVKGDSMINARINDGDIVFIRRQQTVHHGEIAAVQIDDYATLKRFRQYGNHVVLQAENSAVKDIEFDLGDATNIWILGKAVAFQSDVK